MSASLRLPPSGRDFEVFEAVIVAGRATREAAGEFKLSQTRVCQIVERVKQWQAEVVGTQVGTAQPTEEQRLYLAKCVAGGRLDHLYGEAMEAWRRSQGQLKKTRSSRFGDEVTTTVVSCGDTKYLMAAMRLATAQAELPAAGWMLYAMEEESEGDNGRPEAIPREIHPKEDCSGHGETKPETASATTGVRGVNEYTEATCDESDVAQSIASRELFGPVQLPQPAAKTGVVTTIKVQPLTSGITLEHKRDLTRQQRRRLKRLQRAR